MRETKMTYTDQQVKKMLSLPWIYYTEQLRLAAKERGAGFSSITPIAEVVDWLRFKTIFA